MLVLISGGRGGNLARGGIQQAQRLNSPRGGGGPRGRPVGRGGNNLVGTIPTPTATPVAQSPLPPPQPQLQPPQLQQLQPQLQSQQQPAQSPLQRVAPQHTMNG